MTTSNTKHISATFDRSLRYAPLMVLIFSSIVDNFSELVLFTTLVFWVSSAFKSIFKVVWTDGIYYILKINRSSNETPCAPKLYREKMNGLVGPWGTS